MHFFLALVFLYAVLVGNGIKVDESEWIVKETLDNGPAEQMGVEAGDRVAKLNQMPVEGWWDFATAISESPDELISLEVQRNGETYILQGQLGSRESLGNNQNNEIGFIGIARSEFKNIRVNPAKAILETGKEFGFLTRETVVGLGNFFSPTGLGDFFSNVFGLDSTNSGNESIGPSSNNEGRVVSVVGATRIGAQLTEAGWPGLLLFLATINVFIGFFNLIPLLPLDGGHIAVAIYERFRSKKGVRYHADASKLLPLTYTVVFVLIAIGLAAIYLDIADPISL
jgi:membrane-associated protease RseP (regulator of RpoE activity)